MVKSQFRSKRKVSGTKYKDLRKKRLSDAGSEPTLTVIGSQKLKVKRVMGGNLKASLLRTEFVFVTKENKTEKLKIDAVVGNPANINYTRRNIITKGCIVKTTKGDVRITSRPGQSGALFGVFTN